MWLVVGKAQSETVSFGIVLNVVVYVFSGSFITGISLENVGAHVSEQKEIGEQTASH